MATARQIAQGVPLAVPSSDDSDLEDITVIPNSPQSVCEDEEGVAIVSVAKSILVYRIPRFPVVTINLRQFTFEGSFRKRRNSRKNAMSHSWERITLPFP